MHCDFSIGRFGMTEAKTRFLNSQVIGEKYSGKENETHLLGKATTLKRVQLTKALSMFYR